MGDLPINSPPDPRAIDQNPPTMGDVMPTRSEEQRLGPQHGISQPHHYPMTPPHPFTGQMDMSQGPPANHQGAYNMGNMSNSLPPVQYRQGQYPPGNQQRYAMPNSPSAMHQAPQFVGHQAAQMHGQGYYAPPPQMDQYYGGPYSHPQPTSGGPARQNMPYYPNQMMTSQPSPTYYYNQPPPYTQPAHPMPNAMMPGYVNGANTTNDPRVLHQPVVPNSLQPVPKKQWQGRPQKQPPAKSKLSPDPDGTEARQNAVRGPPRKPRQSGHAIWIGNLPPQTELMALVKHVCKETEGLESLFLISKSNCAFANFKDEETCTVAQQKLHDSKFQTVRLVSRLRKSTVEVVGMAPPTGPAKNNQNAKSEANETQPVVDESSASPAGDDVASRKTKENESPLNRDKFFILKSLTVEDLELSVQTGIWATQSHNEEALNKAFQTSDNVYLVFSANKSGEYFGYARMTSEINDDPEAAIQFAPKTPAASDLDLPKAIPTEATDDAPKGRIIDDSARGTIFWEAERDEVDNISDSESVLSDRSAGVEDEPIKTWGKPFKLEWLSTSRLPFFRTRGLRNPWNSNREVKIARDGTEMEPAAGRRLIGLFNRPQPAGAGTTGGGPIPAVGFPPQMRAYRQG